MQTTQAYKDAITALSREYTLSGTIGDYAFTEANVMPGTLKIDNKAVYNSAFEFGACYMGLLEVTLRGLEIDRLTAIELPVELTFTLRTLDGTFDVPLGLYRVIEADRAAGDAVSIKALDRMYRFEIPLPEVTTDDEQDDEGLGQSASLPFIGEGDAYSIITMACEICNVELATTEQEINAMPNASRIFKILVDASMQRWLDVLVNLLAWLGAFGTINREGQLEVRQFFEGDSHAIHPDHIKTSKIADVDTTFNAVSAKSGGRTLLVTLDDLETGEVGSRGMTLSLGENQFAMYDANENTEDMLSELLDYIKDIAYTPFQVTFTGDPSFELGEPVSALTRSGEVQSVITAMTWRYGGSHDVIGVGENIATAGGGFTQKQVASKLAEIGSAIMRMEDRLMLYVEGESSKTISLLEQTATDLTLTFESILDSINELGDDVEADLENLRVFFRFSQDGIVLGRSDSPFQVLLKNDRISFMEEGQEVAYISDKMLYITVAEILESLRLGPYAFMPRSNGNMSLVWIG